MLLVDDLAGVGLSVGPADAAVAGGGGTDAEYLADFVLFIKLLFGILRVQPRMEKDMICEMRYVK